MTAKVYICQGQRLVKVKVKKTIQGQGQGHTCGVSEEDGSVEALGFTGCASARGELQAEVRALHEVRDFGLVHVTLVLELALRSPATIALFC